METLKSKLFGNKKAFQTDEIYCSDKIELIIQYHDEKISIERKKKINTVASKPLRVAALALLANAAMCYTYIDDTSSAILTSLASVVGGLFSLGMSKVPEGYDNRTIKLERAITYIVESSSLSRSEIENDIAKILK